MMKNNFFFKTFICILFIILSSAYPNNILSQQTCPVGFNLPEDSDETNPLCADINIDDGVVVLNNDVCNVQFSITIDVDIAVAVEELFLDINLVDENLNQENMLCFDNIFDVTLVNGLERGTTCGVDHTFQVINNGSPIILEEVMDGLLVGINVNRPSEFEDNCYYFVFELTYLDVNGFSCSYFGDLEVLFPPIGVGATVCGPFELAGDEECEIPRGVDDLDELDNFTSSFQGTHSTQCDHEMPLNHQNIFPFTDQICFPVPAGGCTEIEMIDCPSGKPTRCVDALDLIELRKLILGISNQTDNNPYGGLLSDINQSGAVSTLDILLIQEGILQIENPETRVGECVIFDPTDDGLDGVELNGLGGWSSDNKFTVEVCDGEEFEIVMGVMGDTNGSCSCEKVIEGLNDEDEEEELVFTWDKNNCTFSVPQESFYDLSLDIVGDISSINISEELNSMAMVNVYHREEGYQGEEGNSEGDRYSIIINSVNSQALSLEESISYISFECNGAVELTEKSFIINDNVKVQEIDLSQNVTTRNNFNKDESSDLSSIKVQGSRIFISQEDEEITDLHLYTYNGTLVYSQKLNVDDYVIDLSDRLRSYASGSLFIVVGRTSKGSIVEKLLW
jgi:hypothetical protein